MKPYFANGMVTLYHGDCLEVEAWLTADVLVMDPPYGIAYNSGSRREVLAASIVGDEDTSLRDAVLERWRGRPALVFGTWRIPRPDRARARLVWDTGGALGMGDLSIPWKPSDQEIYVLGREGWTGHRGSNVLSFAPVQSTARGGRRHPHQKPVRLMEELVSKTVGVVADPFAGVGSTLVAAQRLGRRAVGVEVEERYCEIAAERLSMLPLDLWGDAA